MLQKGLRRGSTCLTSLIFNDNATRPPPRLKWRGTTLEDEKENCFPKRERGRKKQKKTTTCEDLQFRYQH